MIRRAASRIPRSRISHRAESHKTANNERNVVLSRHVDSSHNPKPLMTVHGAVHRPEITLGKGTARSSGCVQPMTITWREHDADFQRHARARAQTSAVRRRRPAGPEEEAQERDVNASRDPNFLGQPVARARGPCDPPKSWIRCRGPVVVVPVTSIPTEALQSQRPMPKNRHACTPGTFTLSRRPRETREAMDRRWIPRDPLRGLGVREKDRLDRGAIGHRARCFDRGALDGRSNGIGSSRMRSLSRLSLLSGPLDESCRRVSRTNGWIYGTRDRREGDASRETMFEAIGI